MAELRLIALLLLALLAYALARGLGPGTVLSLVLVILALIGLAMTIISSIQSWKADRRYLSGRALAWIQIGIGTALAATFAAAGHAQASPATAIALLYIAGGAVVLAIYIARPFLRRR